jgi:membrane-bound lytic murein transglycosylase B
VGYFISLGVLFFIIIFFFFFNKISAEENLAEICDLNKVEQICKILNSSDCRALLEKCEKYYQEESDRIEKDVTKTEAEKKTLQNKIYSLNEKIKNLSYQVARSNLIIADLSLQIEDTSKSIDNTSLKIEDIKEKISNILRTINREDKKSLLEILFSEKELSGFFSNLTALESLDAKNKELLEEIKILKENLEKEKEALDNEKNGLEKMVQIQTLQKIENDKLKKEQEQYLKITEQEYQKQLKKKEETTKKAAEIRARIFELFGVAKAPSFGEAYEIAKYTSQFTGVRPAFLLAILTQESNIGKNVGQCFLSDINSGAGKNIKNNTYIPKVMNPQRDVPYFLELTKFLGRDPFSTAVSCPMSFGWGGAMGPAQFIPSTWKLYENKIKNIIGKSGDPWNVKDAFVAAAIYLADFGASKKTWAAEYGAALGYFSGSTSNTKYSFYAKSVMNIASQYEEDIKEIEAANGKN